VSLAHRSNHTVVTAACLAGRSHCAALGDDRSAPRRARDHNSRLSHEWTIPAPTARHPSSQRFSPRSQRSRNSVVGVTKGWIVARADQPWPGAAATTSSDRDPQGSGFPRQRHYGSRYSSGRHELQAAGYADARACWPPPAACRAAASYTGRRTGLHLHHCVTDGQTRYVFVMIKLKRGVCRSPLGGLGAPSKEWARDTPSASWTYLDCPTGIR